MQIGDELAGDTGNRVTGDDEHVDRQIGETCDHGDQLVGVDGVERRVDVAHLGRPHLFDGVIVRLPLVLADPLRSRAELVGEIALHRVLQRTETSVPELRRQAYDGGGAGARCRCEVGDGAEADEVRTLDDDPGDPAFGDGQRRTRVPDAIGDLHGREILDGVNAPPRPIRSLASDNASTVHPAVMEAIAAANTGHALPYGDDDLTRSCQRAFDELFDTDTRAFLTFNGTGSNLIALAALLGPADAVVCTQQAHINLDEAGAPERFLGAKLIDVPTREAKLAPDDLAPLRELLGNPHHVQPAVLSLTQSTELGTVYQEDEVAALCGAAHELGMRVHVDGARIANAVAARGGTREALRRMTVEAGVDVVTFGGTKNGLMGAEAVVFLDPDLATRGELLRKQANQLASKMRYLAAQVMAILEKDRWLELAGHANDMTRRLWEATTPIAGVVHERAPEVNSLFPVLPAAAIEPLREWCFFWDWEPSRCQVRWMTAWDTTTEDVELFARGIRHYLESAID